MVTLQILRIKRCLTNINCTINDLIDVLNTQVYAGTTSRNIWIVTNLCLNIFCHFFTKDSQVTLFGVKIEKVLNNGLYYYIMYCR